MQRRGREQHSHVQRKGREQHSAASQQPEPAARASSDGTKESMSGAVVVRTTGWGAARIPGCEDAAVAIRGGGPVSPWRLVVSGTAMPGLSRPSALATSRCRLSPFLLLAALLGDLLLLVRRSLSLHAAGEADLLSARGLLACAPEVGCSMPL